MIENVFSHLTHAKCPRKCLRILQYLSKKNVICLIKITSNPRMAPEKYGMYARFIVKCYTARKCHAIVVKPSD